MTTAGDKWLLECTVNGREVSLDVEPHRTLLEVLREQLGLTGTKGACLEGECGSCTVLVDGKPMNSCLILAAQMQGRLITTIEGLSAPDAPLDLIQASFVEQGAVQCGYCTPGLILATKAALEEGNEDALRALEGNICRCTGYSKIREAFDHACRCRKQEETQ